MESERIWHLVTNPAWRPLTEEDTPGYLFLLIAGIALIALTVWTYLGAAGSNPRRVGILIALRLTALLLAVMLALRPSAAITEIPKLPSTLIIVVDSSESMTIKDVTTYTRWEVVRKMLQECGPVLDELANDQQVTIYQYHFNKDFDPERDKLTEETKPDGKRTDFGTMLSKLYDRHQGERLVRGVLILSDGADNGTAKPALVEAARFRGIACPIYCFGVGSTTARSEQKDIGFVSINPDPSPAAIKSEIKVKAKVNAPGFEGGKIKVKLSIDGEQKAVQEFELTKTNDNEIEIVTKAPDTPGEVKVKLELVDAPESQVTKLNDNIETYLTVTKEGVRILVLSKDGWELKYIRRALASDKRFDYVEAIRSSEALGTPDEARQFDIKDQRYDVIIFGDISPKMLTSVRPTILEEIKNLVVEKGVGFMMTGGAFSFGGTSGIFGADGWKDTPIADILPVTLPKPAPKDNAEPTKMVPTEFGLQHYLMRLAGGKKENEAAWELLNSPETQLQGFSFMGEKKQNAIDLARAGDAKGPQMLAGLEIGKGGRVLAFAASDTYFWTRPLPDAAQRKSANDLHTRFWKQMVLWLAHQDEVDGNVYVKPEYRRLVAGGQQKITMGLRDKRGDDVPNADLKFQVVGPGEQPLKEKAKRPDRDPKGNGTTSFDAKVPGEYRVVVWGEGKDANNETISGDASARYMVYPDISDEMLRPAANPDFLLALENTANGTARDTIPGVDQLPTKIKEMRDNPPKMPSPKPKPYPDWRRDKQKVFLPLVLVLFVAILGLEWGLRRAWGMV
jgi:hypothetical protein